MAFMRFVLPKKISQQVQNSSQFKRQLFTVKRISSDSQKKQNKSEVYQVTTDTHKQADLERFKSNLDDFGLFSVLDPKKEALLVVKENEITIEDVFKFAAKPKK